MDGKLLRFFHNLLILKIILPQNILNGLKKFGIQLMHIDTQWGEMRNHYTHIGMDKNLIMLRQGRKFIFHCIVEG